MLRVAAAAAAVLAAAAASRLHACEPGTTVADVRNLGF